MKWFLTGGSGLLGGFLIEQVLARGDEAVNFDVEQTGTLSHRKLEPIADYTFFRGDILESTEIVDAVVNMRPDIVVHLAAQSGVAQAKNARIASAMLNVVGTLNVLEAAHIAHVPKGVIVASTNHIYGNQGDTISARWAHQEDVAPLNERNWYTATKIAADVLAQAWAYNYDLDVVAIRPTNAFGPGDPHIDHIIPATILSILDGKQPTLKHTGKTTKAYMHAADTASAMIAVAENIDTFNGQAVNIVGTKPISVESLVAKILMLMESPLTWKTLGEPYDGHDEALSGAKLRSVGWEPKYTLDAALLQTIEFYRTLVRNQPVEVA